MGFLSCVNHYMFFQLNIYDFIINIGKSKAKTFQNCLSCRDFILCNMGVSFNILMSIVKVNIRRAEA